MLRLFLLILMVVAMTEKLTGIPSPPSKYKGMLQNGKPLIATMYYERYYNFPDEYSLMDRDLEHLASQNWTVAFTDYTHLSLGPVWDHYYETAKRLGIFVMPDQWNAAFHAGGPFYARTPRPVTETGGEPTGFAPGCIARYNDPRFIEVMVEYQSQVLTRYINHPAYPRIMGSDGKMHPLMIVIYETEMCDYDGHWIDYSPDSKQQWLDYQKQHLGKILAEEPPKSTDLDKKEALILWNEFRAEYLSNGWNAVARGLKAKFPGLYTMVSYRQHGLLEGSKSGVNAGGMGRRAIRPELWKDFDIVASEHDGDDGIEYVLAEADLIKSAAVNRMGALIIYLDSGYKASSARPVDFHRPWGQSEMLGSLSLRGLLPFHYGYNERDDRAGIAAIGRREKDAPLWQKAACEETAEANEVFQQVAPYLYAAKAAPARAAIVLPFESYAIHNADEVPLDRSLVRICRVFQERDIPVDWVFSSADRISRYKLLVVPDALYNGRFRKAIDAAEKKGMKIIRLPFPSETIDLSALTKNLDSLAKELRASSLPQKSGAETGLLIGKGYQVDVIVNHGNKPLNYTIKEAVKAYPEKNLSGGKLTVPAHRSAWIIRNIE